MCERTCKLSAKSYYKAYTHEPGVSKVLVCDELSNETTEALTAAQSSHPNVMFIIERDTPSMEIFHSEGSINGLDVCIPCTGREHTLEVRSRNTNERTHRKMYITGLTQPQLSDILWDIDANVAPWIISK